MDEKIRQDELHQAVLPNFFEMDEAALAPVHVDAKPLNSEDLSLDLRKRPSWNVEANFMVLPIFCFDKKGSGSRSSQLLSTLPSVIDGSVVTRQILVTTGEREDKGKIVRDSRPGAFDMTLLFCLMDLWEEQGRTDEGVVHFSLNEICRRLRMTDAGKNYQAIKNSLLRLCRTRIESKNAFYSQDHARYLTVSVSILESAIIGTRNDSKGGGRSGRCSVILGKEILNNLKQNFSVRISREAYQSLENGFAIRLLCLALFREQVLQKTGVLDFELNELSELLPIFGSRYPSQIKSRLKNALRELKERKIFDHEFIETHGHHLLRLKSMNFQARSLVGVQAVDQFLECARISYGNNVVLKLQLSSDVLIDLLDRFAEVILFKDREYSRVFHVIDVVLYQVARGYEIEHPTGFISHLLKKKELDYPVGFQACDVRAKEILLRRSAEVAIESRTRQTQEAQDKLFEMAAHYVSLLSAQEFESYYQRAIEESPLFASMKSNRDSPIVRSKICEYVLADMKSGKEFSFSKALASGRESTRIGN